MTRIHNGQTRLPDKPYINHSLHVLQNVLKYKIKTISTKHCLVLY